MSINCKNITKITKEKKDKTTLLAMLIINKLLN